MKKVGIKEEYRLNNMRKQIFSLLALLCLASGLFFSCTRIGSKQVGALQFDSLQVNRTSHLFGDTALPACSLSVSFTYATEAAQPEMTDSLNTYFTSLVLGHAYLGQQPEAALKNYADQYVNDYRHDLEPTYRQDEKENGEEVGAWYSYYKTVKSQVQFYQKNLLVYRYRYEEYTGGAHGIYMTSFLNLNLDTLLPIRLDDLFVADAQEALTDLLWNQLMADHRVATREELEDMGYASTGELAPTENFYLDDYGITFYYNVYEIAPYVMGPTEIRLPWDMVKHLRKMEF